MASNDPRPAEKPPLAPAAGAKKPSLSSEDAELYASRIRPSWELLDDVMAAPPVKMGGDPPYPPAQPAGSKAASDTVIQGVPTLAVGSDVPVEEPSKAAPEAPKALTNGAAAHADPPAAAEPPAPPRVAKTLDGEEPAPAPPAKPSRTLVDEAPKAAEKPEKPSKTLADAPAAPAAKARAGKTMSGVGTPAASKAETPKPKGASKTRPDEAPASAKGQVAEAAPAASAKLPGDMTDEIELPVSGGSGTFLKVGLAAVAVIGAAVIAYGVMGGSSKTPSPEPTAAPTVAAKAPPPPAPKPEPVATAKVTSAPTPSATVSAAPSATPSAAPSATAKATAEPKPAPPEPKPEPKAAAPEPKPEPKAAAPEPKPPKAEKPAKPAAAAPKKGDSIIRAAPF